MLKYIITTITVTISALLSFGDGDIIVNPGAEPAETSVVSIETAIEDDKEVPDEEYKEELTNEVKLKKLEEIALDLAGDFVAPLYGWTYNKEGEAYFLKTREDFKNYYKKIANMELANEFIDAFFIEVAGALEIIPTEPPLWFLRDLPYEFTQISDDEMKISQFSAEDLYGPTTMEIYYKKNNQGKWIINNVTYTMEENYDLTEM